MSGLAKEIFGAQLWQGAILLCATVVQLAAARFIGPAGLGVTAVMVASYSFCFLLIELNLQSALVRKISLFAREEERDGFKAKILRARVVLALGLAPIVAAGVSLPAHAYRGTIFLGIVAAVIAQELNPSWWLQGLGQSSRYFRLAGYLALVAAVTGAPLVYLVRQPGMENLLLSLVGILFYGAYWWRQTVPFQFAKLKESVSFYAGFAWEHKSFLLGGAAVYLYLYPAQWLLASTRSVEEAGLYRVAMMPGAAYYALTVAAFNAYYPRVVRAHSSGGPDYGRTLRGIVLLVYGVGVVAWLATLVFSDLFRLAVGRGFEVSVLLAPVLVISKAIGGVGLVVRAALLAQARERTVFGVFLTVGLTALAANLIVIPRYGYVGAAVVEITMEVVHLAVLLMLLAACTIKPKQPIVAHG